MKKSTLITTLLLALGTIGAAQAAPEKGEVATAAIVLAHCDTHSTTPCGINDSASAEKTTRDREPEALASNAPNNKQAIDPVAEVPEPQTFVMLMLGLVVLGFASRRGEASETFTD
ncbi:PEP-CTERM sorting domain-containing protein [Duganella caerulea]|uniref:PEP-CTERM sorting domain-containing protein n=1 Tax=Duganella caerulea TaxID=2885762 RepID=UPI004038464E